jgi:hypothetical protein
MTRKQPALLAQARAYYRLAVKAERAGQYRLRDHYRSLADQRVARHRRNVEAAQRRKA